jgi:glycyl-tRNA synthetase
MAEIEHYVHPDRKDHVRFEQVKHIELNLLPATQQMKGSTEVIKMTIGDAVGQASLVSDMETESIIF